jgi:hypothetical protein
MHVLSNTQHLIPPVIFDTLKLLAYGFASPFVLVAVLATLPWVLLDFAWFRTHEMLHGSPAPKGLWEF